MNLSEKIINKIKEMKVEAFTINDIIELDTYDNIRKNLERMAKTNKIRRLLRGVYDIPCFNKTFNLPKPPSIDGIAKAIARNYNWDIYPTGNFALNVLGLSTQVPAQYLYVSSGPYRKYIYENNIIEFKHASLKETNSFSYKTNLIIQAIKELGISNIDFDILKKISNICTKEEINIICDEAKHTKIWIYQYILKIKEIIDGKNSFNE